MYLFVGCVRFVSLYQNFIIFTHLTFKYIINAFDLRTNVENKFCIWHLLHLQCVVLLHHRYYANAEPDSCLYLQSPTIG